MTNPSGPVFTRHKRPHFQSALTQVSDEEYTRLQW